MSTVKADTVQPKDFATDITLGASGDTVTIAADDLRVNTVKDKGGNTLWTSDGSGNVSSVNAGLKGNLVLLTTNTFTDAATSDFTTLIDSTYDVYVFKLNAINPATNSTRFNFQGSIDGGSNYNVTMTTTYFDAYKYESADPYGPELRYVADHDQANGTSYQNLSSGLGGGSDECLVGELYLFGPSSTTYVKHFYSAFNAVYPAAGADTAATFNNYIAGYFNTTLAINAISWKMTAGNMDGEIKMYGLL